MWVVCVCEKEGIDFHSLSSLDMASFKPTRISRRLSCVAQIACALRASDNPLQIQTHDDHESVFHVMAFIADNAKPGLSLLTNFVDLA